MQRRVYPIDTWQLDEHYLRPSRRRLEQFVDSYSHANNHDPLLTFRLPTGSSNSSTPMTIHKSRLLEVQGPLAALANKSHSESTTNELDFEEDLSAFVTIRKFLYLHIIDMRQVPPGFAIVADRWGLSILFRACFAWAERCFRMQMFGPHLRTEKFFFDYMSVIAAVDVPQRFKTHFALQTALITSGGDPGFVVCSALFPLVHQYAAEEREERARKRQRSNTGRAITTHQPPANSTRDNADDEERQQTSGEGGEIPIASNGNAGETAIVESEDSEDEKSLELNLQGKNIWDVFIDRGMIYDVVRYLGEFCHKTYWIDLLDVVLRLLEPRLSDLDMLKVLRLLPWHSLSREYAVVSEMTKKWSPRACRLLAGAIVDSHSRHNRDMNLSIRVEGLSLWGERPILRLICGFNLFGHELKAYLKQDDPEQDLKLQFSFEPEQSSMLVRRIIRPRVQLIEDRCACGSELQWERRTSISGEKGGVRMGSGIQPSRWYYTLMSAKRFDEWKQAHTRGCGFVLRISVKDQEE